MDVYLFIGPMFVGDSSIKLHMHFASPCKITTSTDKKYGNEREKTV
jgi:hypothetical protein